MKKAINSLYDLEQELFRLQLVEKVSEKKLESKIAELKDVIPSLLIEKIFSGKLKKWRIFRDFAEAKLS